MAIYTEDYEPNTYPPRPKGQKSDAEQEIIDELKGEIEKLGPQWNLFGVVDKMKFLIAKLDKMKNERK